VPESAAFARCLEGDAGAARIRSDVAAATRLGVEATPTLLVNGYRMDGAPPLDTLLAYVRRAGGGADRSR
jgi:protein-disulfide isomerase